MVAWSQWQGSKGLEAGVWIYQGARGLMGRVGRAPQVSRWQVNAGLRLLRKVTCRGRKEPPSGPVTRQRLPQLSEQKS